MKKTGAFILAAALISTNVLAADVTVKFGETEVSFSESEPSESFLLMKYFFLGAFDLFSEYIDCTQNPGLDEDDSLNFYNIKAECCLYAESQFFDKMNFDPGIFE